MQISEQSKANLKRFGCSVQPRENLLYVSWTDLDRHQALAATILVRTIYVTCSTGPLLCLALEISPTRALAHYCYFPINLKNRTQQAYLVSLAQEGQLHLVFVAGRKIISRSLEIPPTQRKRIIETHSKGLEALKDSAEYKFSDVVEEFEKTFRIPQFFERVVSEEEICKTLGSLSAKADQLPAEKRVLAHQIVHGIADVLQNRYRDKVRKFIADMLSARTAFLTLFDYQRELGDDYERIVNCLTDHIAVNTEEEALRQASNWPQKLESILRTLEDANTSTEEREKVDSEFKAALGRVLDYLSRGRGLSISVLQGIVLPFRALLPAQPGRPVEDYSREYEWKASGGSWTEVAMKHFQENADVRAEFGGPDFSSLAFEHKETLRNRVREGVRSYAERAGKPFPLPEQSTVSLMDQSSRRKSS
jgi:hypothetical protein